MKKDEHELFAIYNELEEEFEDLKAAIRSGKLKEHIGTHVGISPRLVSLIEYSDDFADFLDSCRTYNDIYLYEIVSALLAHKYKDDVHYLDFVTSALEATETTRYIEVADKLKKCKAADGRKVKEERIVTMVLDMIIKHGKSYPKNPIELKDKRTVYGKKHTIKSELSHINRTAKKVDHKHTVLTNKFNNISRINVEELYYEMKHYFKKKGMTINEDSPNLEAEVRRAVMNDMDGFIYFLSETEELQFVESQQLGKIR